ncbi:hypothetical protein Bca52824_061906 [Brassica carinata]|uniref:Rab-GAP TBC domain-containing protein n=1 Tax=Brassica carinata TaxID=52824 RepID=A0A8X7U8W5_BRACI|nr:hypothetical protein Bca52824_061906 [Brassica carinata]
MGGVCEAELSHRTKCHWPRPCVALQSLPDSPGIRSTVWKLLLGYLPPERSLWSSELKQKRSQYKHYKDELLASPLVRNHMEAGEVKGSHAEADAFFCFVELLSGFRDFYCQQLDNSVVGIWSAITRLSQLVNPQFYAFRWITLLLTQEFSFFDSLHIWDALLSDPEGKLTGDMLCDAGTGEEEVDRWRFHI